MWSVVPYYSLFIEAENKSKFFGNGVGFLFCCFLLCGFLFCGLFFFFFACCGREWQGYCKFATLFFFFFFFNPL